MSRDGRTVLGTSAGGDSDYTVGLRFLDLPTGRRSAIRDIVVQDPAGMLMGMPDLVLSADAGSYVYGFTRLLSTLYLVTGLK